jgi:hypothetical protein
MAKVTYHPEGSMSDREKESSSGPYLALWDWGNLTSSVYTGSVSIGSRQGRVSGRTILVHKTK